MTEIINLMESELHVFYIIMKKMDYIILQKL